MFREIPSFHPVLDFFTKVSQESADKTNRGSYRVSDAILISTTRKKRKKAASRQFGEALPEAG
jgi:hypothetical protein